MRIPQPNRILSLSAHLLLAALLASCGGTGGINRTTALDAGAVMDAVDKHNSTLRSLEASGNLSIDTPELSNSGNIFVRLLKPDSVYVDITGPFGVGVAKGLITTASFTFYNGLDNTVMLGATSANNLRSVLRMSLDFQDVVGIISGTMGFHSVPPDVRPVTTRDEHTCTLTWTTNEGSLEYVVDLDYSAVTRFTRRDLSSSTTEEILFKDFHKRSGLYLPSIASVSRPPDENLTIVYERQNVNPSPLDFAFKVPKNARKIHI